MPGGDRTGPRGMGAMTGRAAGYCAGYDGPGHSNALYGQGYGGRRGYGAGGRGRRNMFYATGLPGWARYGGYAAFCPYPNPYGEIDQNAVQRLLKNQADTLQAQLDLVKKRLSDLETEAKTE